MRRSSVRSVNRRSATRLHKQDMGMGMEEGRGSGWVVLNSKHSKGVCDKAKKRRILAARTVFCENQEYQKEKNKKEEKGDLYVLKLDWKYMHYIAKLDTKTGALRPDVRSRRRSLAPWCGPRGSVGYQANGQRASSPCRCHEWGAKALSPNGYGRPCESPSHRRVWKPNGGLRVEVLPRVTIVLRLRAVMSR